MQRFVSFCWIIVLLSTSCTRKVFLSRDEKQADYKIRASDGKKIDGLLYVEFEKLKTRYYLKTNRFGFKELLHIKSEVNKKVPSNKMIIYGSVVGDSLDIGLYYVSIVDLDQQKARKYLGLNEELSREVRSVSFPILKFKNDVRINICFRCSEEELKLAEEIAKNFKLAYSQVFNSNDIKTIDSSFVKGMNTYTGHGRYRE